MKRNPNPKNTKPIHPKVAAGSVGGMVATVLLWALSLAGVNPPPDVSAALAGLLIIGFAYGARALLEEMGQSGQSAEANPELRSVG